MRQGFAPENFGSETLCYVRQNVALHVDLHVLANVATEMAATERLEQLGADD